MIKTEQYCFPNQTGNVGGGVGGTGSTPAATTGAGTTSEAGGNTSTPMTTPLTCKEGTHPDPSAFLYLCHRCATVLYPAI
jgi:hypothetical protein